MLEKFTIRKVILTMSKLGKPMESGVNYIVIEGKTESGAYESDWVGESAPSGIIDRWWKSAGLAHRGWESFSSSAAFDLIGKEVFVKLEAGNYGNDIVDVRPLESSEEKPQENPAPTAAQKPTIVDDDIPF